MRTALIVAVLVLGALLGVLTAKWRGAEGKAAEALALAEVDRQENKRLRVKQQADSTALEVARATHAGDLARIAQERAQARQDARRASLAAQGASESLRHTLDSLGASTTALDSLNAAHADGMAAKDEQIAAADSATALVQGLLVITEQALESERMLRRGAESEASMLRTAVAELQSSRKRERWVSGGTLALVVAVALLR